jgi:DNA polymerase-3 subunit gamma/tau
MLSMSAFNALLKIIEEPPEHLMFILATTELHKVPATILSRCQRFSFRRLLQEDIGARLNYIAYEEGIDIEPEAIRLLARLADGALRDGVSLLDQCASAASGSVTAELVCSALGLAGQKETARLMQAAADHDAKTALELFSGLYAGGKDIAAMLDEMAALSRDLLILKTAPKSGLTMLSGVSSEQEALTLVNRFTAAELIRITTVLQETTAGFSKSANRRVDAELCLLRLCDPALDLDAAGINARLSRVEDRLATGMFVQAAAPAPEPEDDDRPPMPGDEDVPPLPEEPMAQQAPPQPQAPPAFWTDFLAKLHMQLPSNLKGYFSPEGPVKPALEQDLLTLVADSAFVKKMVDVPQVTEAAIQAASAVLARPIRVRIALKGKNGPVAGGPDPMDKLVAFGREHSDVIKIKEN